MTVPVGLGVLGCGGMGFALAEAARVCGLGRVVSVFDIDKGKKQALTEACGAEAAPSEEALLSEKSIEALIIATPQYAHCEATVHAARAGKHVFVEKPMALGVAECEKMIQAAKEAGVTIMVGHVLRYYEPFRTIIQWAREGRLGRPLHLDLWRVRSGWDSSPVWRASKKLSGGYLYQIGAHEFDFMRLLAGEPVSVHAVVQKSRPADHEIEDMASVHVAFNSNAAGSYLGGVGFGKCLEEFGFCLRFEKATLRSSEGLFNPKGLTIHFAGQPEAQNAGIKENAESPLIAEIRDWLSSIIEKSPVPIPGEDACKTVALVEAAYRSASSGQTVAI